MKSVQQQVWVRVTNRDIEHYTQDIVHPHGNMSNLLEWVYSIYFNISRNLRDETA